MLYKRELFNSFETMGYIVGFIVGMHIEYCLWAQVAVLDIYIGLYRLFGTGLCRFYIWVELPVQRRLCPIFVRNRVTRHSRVFPRVDG